MTSLPPSHARHPPGHTKVSRANWIDAAVAALIEEGLDHVKVMSMAQRLGVSRSSFYWYFEDRQSLLDELLDIWTLNTTSIVDRSRREAGGIIDAVLGVFECWADERLFNPRLDFAIRDWARRDDQVRALVESADETRVDAISSMFAVHGYDASDSIVRARMLYHSQVGYYAVETHEPTEVRLHYLPYYLRAMTGIDPTSRQLTRYAKFMTRVTRS